MILSYSIIYVEDPLLPYTMYYNGFRYFESLYTVQIWVYSDLFDLFE